MAHGNFWKAYTNDNVSAPPIPKKKILKAPKSWRAREKKAKEALTRSFIRNQTK